MADSLFTTGARRHIALMLRELIGEGRGLERGFRKLLRKDGLSAGQVRTLLALLPTAASPLSGFEQRVQHHGRYLAKLNVPVEQAESLLRRFDTVASDALGGRFAPAREQLLMATLHNLHLAFYQVREAEAQAFFGIYRAESEAANLDDLLRRFVAVLARTFGARTGRLVLSSEAAPRRPLCVQCGSPEGVRTACPPKGRYCYYWSYPLTSPGAIQLTFTKPRRWLPRELALLEAAAARCQEAIERARREGTIRRLEAQARAAEEDERRRIGRELHDEAGQALMVLRLRLEMIEREAPEKLRPRVREARNIAEGTIVELRRIISALGPAVLARLGLDSALRQLGARFRKNHSAALRIRIALGQVDMPKSIQEVVYRVAQECLQNVVKHSAASHVNLSLRAADGRVRLSVSDDGSGFQVESGEVKPMSFGLAGMRERAALFGGDLKIRSAPARGTTVVLELPLTPCK